LEQAANMPLDATQRAAIPWIGGHAQFVARHDELHDLADDPAQDDDAADHRDYQPGLLCSRNRQINLGEREAGQLDIKADLDQSQHFDGVISQSCKLGATHRAAPS
jgi:hypothetical protein